MRNVVIILHFTPTSLNLTLTPNGNPNPKPNPKTLTLNPESKILENRKIAANFSSGLYFYGIFLHSHVLIPIPMHLVPIPIPFPFPWLILFPWDPMGIPWDPMHISKLYRCWHVLQWAVDIHRH